MLPIIKRLIKNKSWNDEYISVLLNGPQKNDDMYALELIESNYAKGDVSRETGIGNRTPHVYWQGVTVKGRLFLNELQEKKYKSSLAYKIKSATFFIAGSALGFISQILIKILTT